MRTRTYTHTGRRTSRPPSSSQSAHARRRGSPAGACLACLACPILLQVILRSANLLQMILNKPVPAWLIENVSFCKHAYR